MPGPAILEELLHRWRDDAGGTYHTWFLWEVAAAFEVEHTTSIYSGIVRLLDLALGAAESTVHGLFLVAPDAREAEVRAQLRRPAFRSVAGLQLRYLAYSDLEENRDAMTRFGQGLRPLDAIARAL